MIGSISIWAPLIYQYGVGGVLFLACLVLILRARACDVRRRTDRFWLFAVLTGMLAYFAVHLSIYLLALHAVPDAPPTPGAPPMSHAVSPSGASRPKDLGHSPVRRMGRGGRS